MNHTPFVLTLDPKPTTFAQRDGVDFVSLLGARSERCLRIVIDERRRSGAKAARPPLRVVPGSPLDIVAALARATSPRFTPLLASELP